VVLLSIIKGTFIIVELFLLWDWILDKKKNGSSLKCQVFERETTLNEEVKKYGGTNNESDRSRLFKQSQEKMLHCGKKSFHWKTCPRCEWGVLYVIYKMQPQSQEA
jgi:hypothetical protein